MSPGLAFLSGLILGAVCALAGAAAAFLAIVRMDAGNPHPPD